MLNKWLLDNGNITHFLLLLLLSQIKYSITNNIYHSVYGQRLVEREKRWERNSNCDKKKTAMNKKEDTDNK